MKICPICEKISPNKSDVCNTCNVPLEKLISKESKQYLDTSSDRFKAFEELIALISFFFNIWKFECIYYICKYYCWANRRMYIYATVNKLDRLCEGLL
ncbi:hypothetical protein SDC9_152044 [bioreactor metagenome]|uniref:Uncharacterized protein n=1 Tax=bioreactor metagenome TaxID=1076179 RepID=A0A645ETP2_9ZZZZ